MEDKLMLRWLFRLGFVYVVSRVIAENGGMPARVKKPLLSAPKRRAAGGKTRKRASAAS